jgi:hypothetical protein
MILSVDNGLEDAVNDPEGFTLDIPVLTMEQVKSISETWIPMMDADLVSKADVQNRIPGINPSETNKQIQSEKEENIQNFSGNIGNIINKEISTFGSNILSSTIIIIPANFCIVSMYSNKN